MRKDSHHAQTLRLYAAVGCGAAIGSLLRFLSGAAILAVPGLSPLLPTAFVNIVGSFIIMLFATLTGPDGRLLVGPVARQFVTSGLCGGLTTFSALSLETFMVLWNGNATLAAIYIAAVVIASLVAAWIGYALGAWLNS